MESGVGIHLIKVLPHKLRALKAVLHFYSVVITLLSLAALIWAFSSVYLVFNHLRLTLTRLHRQVKNEPTRRKSSTLDLSAQADRTTKSKQVRFKEVNEIRVFEVDKQDRKERRQHYHDIMYMLTLRRTRSIRRRIQDLGGSQPVHSSVNSNTSSTTRCKTIRFNLFSWIIIVIIKRK